MLEPLRYTRDRFLETVPGEWRGLRRRRFLAFGLGTPRSGTTSLAAIFEGRYRAEREPDYARSINLLRAVREDQVRGEALCAELLGRDRRLHLELEASCFLSELTVPLQEAFPAARFILTLRDCYSWLDSILNLAIAIRISGKDRGQWFATLFRPERHRYQTADAPLQQLGLYPLDAYLSHWSRVNTHVLSTVDDERLLVVRTPELETALHQLARHLRIPAHTLSRSAAHRNRMQFKHGVLQQLDPSYLRDQCEHYCRPLMDRFFPTVRFEPRLHDKSPATELELQRLSASLAPPPPHDSNLGRVAEWLRRSGRAAVREWGRR